MRTLKTLYLEAARVVELEEKSHGIYPIKYRGKFYNSETLLSSHINWLPYIDEIKFALEVVEGKPVFVGDVLYTELHGSQVFVKERTICQGLVWNPPKPRTVMVELLCTDVEVLADSHATGRISLACRQALERECVK